MRGSRGSRGGPDAPALARCVLLWVVPGEEADVVAGELSEGFARRLEREGPAAARRWYRRQVWGWLWRAAVVRRVTGSRTEVETMGWIEDVVSDVRFAVRGLVKRPGFTIVAVTTLALGIGANSAIFTLVSAHFFEPLPYDRPEQIVLLWETERDNREIMTVAPGNYWTWREEAQSFADVAAFNVDYATLSGDDVAERVTASYVVPHFFDVLGVSPAIGPGFDGEAAQDAEQVLLSHSLWTRRYGADPGLVGREIRIDGRPHTVVGVMPPDYRQPERSLSWQTPELWRPLLLEAQRGNYGSRYLRAVARLREGVPVEQARGEMDAMAARMAEAFPAGNAGRSILVRTLDDYLMSDARPTLLMLLLAGLAVLLIVCANVANLTLARAEERRGEFALRAALGSGRSRLVRQVVVEGLVLAGLGAAVGTLMVVVAGDGLRAVQTRFFTNLVDVSVDLRVVGATALLALGSGLLFGLPLAGSASNPALRSALVEGAARGGGGTSRTARNLLIVGQVGLATTLMVVAALLARSFDALVNVPPGFEAERVVTFEVAPPATDYETTEEMLAYHRALLEEVRSIPGVESVGMASDLMFTGENRFATFAIEGREVDPTRPPRAEYHIVTPQYFETLDIPLRAGAIPEPAVEGDEMPIVVNQRMADTFWPHDSPVGAALTLDWTPPRPMRVVGIVGDVLDDGYDAVADPVFYLPFTMAPSRRMAYVVRGGSDPRSLLTPIREAVARVDADVPAAGLELLEGVMAETVVRPRAASLIGGVFALIALLVAAVGVYGVLSYAVQLRTREIGIRAALGAPGSRLLGMVMGHTLRLVGIGLLCGTVGALLAGRALSGLLYGVRAWDPPSLAVATVVLGSVALLAAWVPARRAVRIDPKEALKAE